MKPLLEEIIKEHKWTETLSKTECDLKWVTRSVDTKTELIPLLTEKKKMVNRYPDVGKLSRKDTFSTLIKL